MALCPAYPCFAQSQPTATPMKPTYLVLPSALVSLSSTKNELHGCLTPLKESCVIGKCFLSDLQAVLEEESPHLPFVNLLYPSQPHVDSNSNGLTTYNRLFPLGHSFFFYKILKRFPMGKFPRTKSSKKGQRLFIPHWK
jgi:hypothetical protein